MFSPLHPAALWTLAVLALPLAIHLWRPPPRTVRLGSLRFLANTSRRPMRNLRWRELLLLCTRLGLLAVLSLLLAELHWITPPPSGPRRWALLDPTAALSGDSLAHWHAARQAGYELRRLAPGFPAAGDEIPPDADHPAPDLWSLLREADAELPAGSTLAVFSPVRMSALRGTRPALGHCRIEAFQTPNAAGGAPHEWVASVSGKRVLAGRSDARSTLFTVKPPDDPAASHPAPPATSVLILHDAEHANDARYTEAAVRAAADSSGHPVNLQNREITPDAENAAVTDWTFWLSTRPVPEGLAGRAPRIVRYAGGETAAVEGWIVAPPSDAADGVRLWKHTIPPSQGPAGVALWTDLSNDPILTYEHTSTGERWEFYSRFDPGWTDLPRTTALPAWMRALLFPENAALADADAIHDRRQADPAQSLPADGPAAAIPALAPTGELSRDLHWPLWILAALLFVVERVLSLLRRPAAPQSVVSTSRPEPVVASR